MRLVKRLNSYVVSYLLSLSYTLAHIIMYSIMTLHLCIRNITKENQEQSKTSFTTRFYLFYNGEWTIKDSMGVSLP
jgi:hypothetical protein